MQLCALPSPHPLKRDGELSLLLRKHTATLSCGVPAWQSAGPLTASLVYSGKYLLLRRVAVQQELIYITMALRRPCREADGCLRPLEVKQLMWLQR